MTVWIQNRTSCRWRCCSEISRCPALLNFCFSPLKVSLPPLTKVMLQPPWISSQMQRTAEMSRKADSHAEPSLAREQGRSPPGRARPPPREGASAPSAPRTSAGRGCTIKHTERMSRHPPEVGRCPLLVSKVNGRLVSRIADIPFGPAFSLAGPTQPHPPQCFACGPPRPDLIRGKRGPHAHSCHQ